MRLAPNVFDVWAFQRQGGETRFLLLHASEEKARRHFGGGRFWQIPSGVIGDDEAVTDAITRDLMRYGLSPTTIWAARALPWPEGRPSLRAGVRDRPRKAGHRASPVP